MTAASKGSIFYNTKLFIILCIVLFITGLMYHVWQFMDVGYVFNDGVSKAIYNALGVCVILAVNAGLKSKP